MNPVAMFLRTPALLKFILIFSVFNGVISQGIKIAQKDAQVSVYVLLNKVQTVISSQEPRQVEFCFIA